MSESVKKAKQRYREKCKRLVLEFYPTEAALTEHIEKQPKKQTYIKDLIRQDMTKRWRDDLLAGLRALGVSGHMTCHSISDWRVSVYIDDEYFGIWDTVRKTFVD